MHVPFRLHVMMQEIVERRFPVRQGDYDRVRAPIGERERGFIPLTEDDLIICYSFSYISVAR